MTTSFWQRGPLLPERLFAELERFGRFEIDPANPEFALDSVPPYVELYRIWEADPHRCYRELADAVIPIGGWTLYGASRALWEVDSSLDHPPGIHLEAMEFLRGRNVPQAMLSSWQIELWNQHRGPVAHWSGRLFTPPVDGSGITPIHPGNVRVIAKMTPLKDANLLVARAVPGDGYVLLIDRAKSFDLPDRIGEERSRHESLHELYLEAGTILKFNPGWVDPEFHPYCPYLPDLS